MFTPGLEVKMAIEEALSMKASIHYGGMGLNDSDVQALKVETRMDVLSVFRNYMNTNNMIRWSREKEDLLRLYGVLGGEAFSESFDRSRANWMVKYFEKIAPH